MIQKENAEEIEKQKKVEIQKQKEKEREKEKQVIDVDVRAMDEIRMRARNLVMAGAGIKEEILKAIEYLNGIRVEFEKVKQGALHLQSFDRELTQIFAKVEQTYFSSYK